MSPAAATNGEAVEGVGLAPQPLGIAALAVVFFALGFLTSLNDILLPTLKAIFRLGYAQAALVQFVFFFAYFCLAIPGGALLPRLGHQRGIALSLLVSAGGALGFVPAAGLASFPLFLAALFCLAAGFALLQVTANPYIAALGPVRTASSRLTLVQAFNSVGTTLGPVLGGLVLLAVKREPSAGAIAGPYLALSLALAALGLAFGALKLPRLLQAPDHRSGLREAVSLPQVRFAALAIFAYVGAEVSIGSFLVSDLGLPGIADRPPAAAARFVALYWGGATIGRFGGGLALRRVPPARLLAVFAAVAGALVLVHGLSSGWFAGGALIAVGLFNSILFPTIFTLGIRGLGPLTSAASGVLVTAIVGGALVPLAVGSLADVIGLQRALLVPALDYALIASFGLWSGSRAAAVGRGA